ncbi:conjugative transposon protein TraN [Hymenobacter tenuis]
MRLYPLFTRLAFVALSVSAAPALAQTTAQAGAAPMQLQQHNFIGSYHLGVGFQKTTHLIFPQAVTYVDLGNVGIIADKVKGAENIVKVKANVTGFPQTNMTVVTADGRLYSFLVDYEANPRVVNYNLAEGNTEDSASQPLARLANGNLTQTEMENYSRAALKEKRRVHLKENRNDVTLALQGIYTQGDTFFLPLWMQNKTNINYDVDFVKFYIRDKKKTKRTAEQETEVAPLYVFNAGQSKIAGPGELERVYVLRKFTIPDDKNLVVEMFERGGGRHLSFNVSNADILEARKLTQ